MSSVPAQPLTVPAHYGPPPRRARWGLRLVLMGMLSFVFVGILMFGVFGLATVGSMSSDSGLSEKYVSHSKLSQNKVAILSLEGMILEGDGFVKKQIDTIKDDKNVKAIVLRVDSPGGTVTGSDFMYHHLKKVMEEKKIPVVVSMGSLCASGGYYVSMAVGAQETKDDVIYAEPTTWTGSIGVLIPHYDLSGLAQRFDIKDDSIKSHELKAMGGMIKEMTPKEREIFKGLVDEMFDRFKGIVLAGRPKMSAESLDKVATGQVFTTKQAIEAGLVDKEGFIEDAVDRAIAIAKLDKDSVRVVKYQRQPTLMDVFTGQAKAQAMASAAARPEWQVFIELSQPKAYYIWGGLPNLMAVKQEMTK